MPSSSCMMLLTCGLALIWLGGAIPLAPTIPNSYFSTIEISSDNFGGSLSFREYRDYEGNRVKYERNHSVEDIYLMNSPSPNSHLSLTSDNCVTTDLYQEAVEDREMECAGTHGHNHHNHGWLFLADYDIDTKHLRTADDIFGLSHPNLTSCGDDVRRGINVTCWTATQAMSHCNQSDPNAPGVHGDMRTVKYYFSASDWQESGVSQVPVVFEVSSTNYTVLPDGSKQFGEVHTFSHSFVNFQPGTPDFLHFIPPHWQYCPSLLQKDLPQLPDKLAHHTTMSDAHFNTSESHGFEFDYPKNQFGVWYRENGEAQYVLYTLNDNTYYNSSRDLQTCGTGEITGQQNKHPWLSDLIDFDVNPPKLRRLTEYRHCGSTSPPCPPYIYGGFKPARDIMAEVWFYRFNGTATWGPNDPPILKEITKFDIVNAWYFADKAWQFQNVPSEDGQSVAIRQQISGRAFNSTSGEWQFVLRTVDFYDQDYSIDDTHMFRVPALCTGGGGGNAPSGSTGLDKGGAAGLAFGMIFLGMLIGAALLWVCQRAGRVSAPRNRGFSRHQDEAATAMTGGGSTYGGI